MGDHATGTTSSDVLSTRKVDIIQCITTSQNRTNVIYFTLCENIASYILLINAMQCTYLIHVVAQS